MAKRMIYSFLLFIGVPFMGTAQGWENGTRWLYGQEKLPLNLNYESYLEFIKYGDTIINEEYYSIIHQTLYEIGNPQGERISQGRFYVQYRDNKMKLRFLDSDIDIPMYDFNLNVGDNFDFACQYSENLSNAKINSIGYFQFGDSLRKIQYTSDSGTENACSLNGKVYEGIGFGEHLIPTPCCIDPAPDSYLICHQEGENFYPVGCNFNTIAVTEPYKPILQDDAKWVEVNLQPSHEVRAFNYYFKGDTIVENKTYKKLFKRQLRMHYYAYHPDFPYGYFTDELFAIMREDTSSRKVYAQVYDSLYLSRCDYFETENLLYDFSLNIGDSFYNPCIIEDSLRLIFIDSTEVFGSKRKTYYLEWDQYLLSTIVEGVGALDGLFPLDPYINFIPEYVYAIYDYCNGTDEECDLIMAEPPVSTNNIPASDISIYPNPAINLLQINSDKEIDQFFIYSNNGNLVRVGTGRQIDVTEWDNGIYFLKVLSGTRTIVSKFVKN